MALFSGHLCVLSDWLCLFGIAIRIRCGQGFGDLAADQPASEPAHGEHVGGGFEQAVAYAVVALARGARVVGYFDFNHMVSRHAHQGGKETMGAFEKDDVAQTLLLEEPVGATRVADVFSQHGIAHGIGDAGGKHLEFGIPARPAGNTGAGDTIRPVDGGEEFGQVCGIVLQVGIKCGDELSARRAHARPQGGGLPLVLRQPQGAGAGGCGDNILKDRPGSIGAAVIHEKDFKGHGQWFKCRRNGCRQRLHISFLIMAWSHHAEE